MGARHDTGGNEVVEPLLLNAQRTEPALVSLNARG